MRPEDGGKGGLYLNQIPMILPRRILGERQDDQIMETVSMPSHFQ